MQEPPKKSAETEGYTLAERLARLVEWTKQKCRIQQHEMTDAYFSEREIWWARIGENVGSEQNGRGKQFTRPVLIVKKFHSGLMLVVPLTTKVKEGPYYIPISSAPNGPKTVVTLSQVKALSSKRLLHKDRKISSEEFERVRAGLRKMLA